MGSDVPPRLHWTQRVAFVRHNLHAARRTNDFSFFKTLQAHALIDGTDHVAILHTVLGNDADSVLSTLDNLNAGIAYVHQDAFKAVYDGAKSTMYKAGNSPSSRKSLLRVDICQQQDMADHAIDKTTNSAINLIEAQPFHCQDAVANAWVTGVTIVADAVSVCLTQMEELENNLDDFIRLEYSWGCIQNSVDAAISALRGIFTLMAPGPSPTSSPAIHRNPSISSTAGSEGLGGFRSRQSSTASALGLIKRAFNHSNMLPATSKTTRSGSLPMPEGNARGFRASMSAACPTKMSNFSEHPHTLLAPIPPTPSVNATPVRDVMCPFKDNGDYFHFNQDKQSEETNKSDSSPMDMMQFDSLDPLCSPTPDDIIKMPEPLVLRRHSQTFETPPGASIAA